MPKPSGLRAIFTIRREELPFALLMFGYFFLVITSFWILKPVKKTLFIGFYDENGLALLGVTLTVAQAELIAKVLNMVVAFVAAAVFSALSERLRRQQLTLAFCGFGQEQPAMNTDARRCSLRNRRTSLHFSRRILDSVFLLVVLSTFPVVLLFLFVRDMVLALHLSQGLALAMLIFGGAVLGRYAGGSPWRYGLGLGALGAGLIAAIVALGG